MTRAPVGQLYDVDPDAILALLRDAFAYMEPRIDPPSSLHRLTAKQIRADAQAGQIWGILDPTLLCCMVLTPKPGRLYIGKLAVTDSHRGQGLARQLVAAAEARAQVLGVPLLELESRIELSEVHAAFARLGFVRVAETAHPGYTQPTSITMHRKVVL